MVCRSIRLQNRKMYRSKRSQESHRKGRHSGFGPENSPPALPMSPIFAGIGRSFQPLRRLTFRVSRRILPPDTSRWGFQQRLSRRVAPEESPKDFSPERFFEIEGCSKSPPGSSSGFPTVHVERRAAGTFGHRSLWPLSRISEVSFGRFDRPSLIDRTSLIERAFWAGGLVRPDCTRCERLTVVV
jgi:hypothetical protein